ncbi:MAG TPA: DUF6609 family protein [Ktedonobacteraceae bacterium]|nr:DUF6609 family protein [Ktedonobacteraceae bacterium]
MSTSSVSSTGNARRHSFPVVRRSGVLALILGASTIFGGAVIAYPFSYLVFFAGIVFGAIAFVVFRDRHTDSKPTRVQIGGIVAALVLAVVALVCLLTFVPNYQSPTFLLLLFLAIAVALLPLSIASGPLLLALAVLCIVNAVVGLLLKAHPFTVFMVIDGVLKIVLGILMMRSRPRQAEMARGAY